MDYTTSSIQLFVENQLELIKLEKDAEISENKALYANCSAKDLREKGKTFLRAVSKSYCSGMYGRYIVTFQSLASEADMSVFNWKPGDLVGFDSFSGTNTWDTDMHGLLTDTKNGLFVIVVNSLEKIEMEKMYFIFRVANLSTYKRMKLGLKYLQKHRKDHCQQMIDVMFDMAKPSSINESLLDFIFENKNLNEDQKTAVRFALCQKEIAVIHGPPGTGKTTTVIELIVQLIKQGSKVLACAPSNVAADNLVEGLSIYTSKITRLGHPARTLPKCQEFTMDYQISNSDSITIIDDIDKNIAEITDSIESSHVKMPYSHLRKEKWKLMAERKKRYGKLMTQLLKSCDVVVSTLSSAHRDGALTYLPSGHFDVCIIDECSQATEATCWIPLSLVKRCVLAGDHCQLPPVVHSQEALEGGFGFTLMERILDLHGDAVKKLLTVQYRMHKDIMAWPSQELYNDKLQAHESNANHLLSDLPDVISNENTDIPLLLIDTIGCKMYDFQLQEEDSKGNEGEADIVALHVTSLIESGLKPADIAVIAPYNLQVEVIRSKLSLKYPELEVRSVDGFQGREKEAVILSLVRSNPEGKLGFLKEDRRINVAITRAKRHLAVICDSQTVSHHPFLKAFVEYLQSRGEMRSAFQYEAEILKEPKTPFLLARQGLENKPKPAKKKSRKPSKDASKIQWAEDSPTSSNLAAAAMKENLYDHLKMDYEQQIQSFLDGDDAEFKFPKQLTGYQRAIIHEIAEKLNLQHKSEGEGLERHIVITKPKLPFDKQGGECRDGDPLSETEHLMDSDECLPVMDSRYSALANDLPAGDKRPCPKPLASSDCQNLPASTLRQEQKSKGKVSKNKTKPLKAMPLEKCSKEDEDFDALIAAAVQQDNMCMFKKCTRNTRILLILCKHCKLRFCTEHIQYEVHGCGQAAKNYERSQVRKLGAVYPGSGEHQRGQRNHITLQKLMDKKLDELNNKRVRNSKK